MVNDNYGHDIGDDVLKGIVTTIKKFSRDDDILIRWGGEEFILILKIDSQDILKKILENLRELIHHKKFDNIGTITCSIGATIYKDGENIQETIKRADVGVYKAKNSGRNCTKIIL